MVNQNSTAEPNVFEALWANEQFKSAVRTGIQTAATALAAKGIYDASMVPTVVGAVMWAIPTVWGLYVRRKAGLVASAAALPEVREIRTTPEIAAALPDPTVTAR
jgi:hypothetical protein